MFSWKEIQFRCTFLDQDLAHRMRKRMMWQTMLCGSNAFFDDTIVLFGSRDMILWISKVQFDTKFVL